jgi:LPXTG-site transpeptidase (sortase) family protein
MDTNSTKKVFSWKSALLLSLGVGLLAAGLSIFLQARSETIHSDLANNPVPVAAAPSAPAGSGSSFEMPGKPARLVIPSIAVDAAVQSVGLFWNGNGEMGIPTNFTDVAWYNGGPIPGMPGSAVIDGHLDGRNVKEAVFYNLGNLKPGDLVEVVDAAGKTWQFQVVRLADYDYNASTTDIFSGDGSKARLNLITCTGDWIPSQKLYNKRIVVFTELVTTSS